MKDILQWGAIEIGRRKFLYRGLVTLFGIGVGLAAGSLEAAAGCPCSAPFGGLYCGVELCSGGTLQCSSHDYGSFQIFCNNTPCCCPGGTGCWSCPGFSCCDCECLETIGGTWYYCFCQA